MMTSETETNYDQEMKETQENDAFKRSTRIVRSPKLGKTTEATKSTVIKAKTGTRGYEQLMREAENDKSSPMEKAMNAFSELKAFVDSKNNIHSEVKTLLLKTMMAMNSMSKEWDKMRKDLDEVRAEQRNAKPMTPLVDTSISTGNLSKKRRVVSPTSATTGSTSKTPNVTERWQTVQKNGKTKAPKQQPRPKENPKPKTRRTKADAIAIGIKDGKPETYSDVLRKIKSDPNLKELGEQVARIRKTQKGELLIEFRSDSAVKSTSYKEMVEKTVGEVATVKSLTQEVVIECLNMDEVTSGEELRSALKAQFELEDHQCDGPIRMRKAFGSTQIGTIKLAMPIANKILEKGKVKVGWSVCPLRISRQLLRCFKCLSFGHQSKTCEGVDRSKACWRCGVDGHQSKDCKSDPKCLLCTEETGNKHATGSLRCKAYKDAVDKKGWK